MVMAEARLIVKCYINARNHHHLLPGAGAVGQWDASVHQALVSALVLVEDLLHGHAALEHLHLLLPLQSHLKPLLRPQHLLLHGRLQRLGGEKGVRDPVSFPLDGPTVFTVRLER